MKPYAQMNPSTKKQRLLAYNQRIHRTNESKLVFDEWELQMDRELVQISGIRMKNETLNFGNNKTIE